MKFFNMDIQVRIRWFLLAMFRRGIFQNPPGSSHIGLQIREMLEIYIDAEILQLRQN